MLASYLDVARDRHALNGIHREEELRAADRPLRDQLAPDQHERQRIEGGAQPEALNSLALEEP